MKLRTVGIKKYKLIKYYLTKYQAYKKIKIFSTYKRFLDQIELNFKKALFIIYNYHIWNRRILFVGLPYSKNKKFLNILIRSKHIFIPKSIWLNGLIGNKKSISKKLSLTYHLKRFLNIRTNPHLIVLFNCSDSDNLVLEASKLEIPIIYFGDTSKKISEGSYLINGYFLKKPFKNFYQFLIYTILKKPKNQVVKKVKEKRFFKKKY